ncbi:MAG: hypothetical protein K2H64_01745 [Desulfovibrio sp.]|nr:hypothetical protein [Desulfovibrio sp.]
MLIHYRAFAILATVLFACAVCACSVKSGRDAPKIAPTGQRVTVAPFTQPLDPAQLITGYIPENQGKIPEDELIALDTELRRVLLKGDEREYAFMPPRKLPKTWNEARSSSQPAALKTWLEYGKEHNAKLLLVPQVMDWKEREGSEAGVTESAYARIELFLLNITDGSIAGRAIFEEKQAGLVDNLLTIRDFVKRRGKWLTARELAADGLTKAVKDLGL